MGKRYYCDYCQRSFIDDLDSRKKHLRGTIHENQRRIHYKSCRDLRTLISEERSKEECRKFLMTGNCNFGEQCYFSHYSKLELQQLEYQADEEERLKNEKRISMTVEEWLEKRRKKMAKISEKELIGPDYPFPLEAINSLPPSLRPITVEQIINTTFSEWG
ncbi:hypothetical protein AAG570_006534 [Ranatra chinensis]|uniref:C3H1-type domain-containing protein n=1 Tax=Ranatra chinensis TaxID=642074 RepID=A0ABD0YUW9_9HEMI